MTFESVDYGDEDEATAAGKQSGLHRVTRRLLKEVLAEQRKDLGVYERYVAHAPHRPNNEGLEKYKQMVKEQKLIVSDLERVLKRREWKAADGA